MRQWQRLENCNYDIGIDGDNSENDSDSSEGDGSNESVGADESMREGRRANARLRVTDRMWKLG